MSGSATAKIANLTRTGITVQVGQGLVTYSVLKGGEANSEIDTPNSAVHPNGPGEYRILVNSDAETEVIVRRGSADISTPQGSTHVNEGQMITVAGTDNPEYKTAAAPGRDDWDSWNADRDTHHRVAKSWSTRIGITLVRKISIPMACGPKFPITARCGFPSRDLIGLPIATAAGFTNHIMAGRGFPMSPGVGRRITMAVGSSTAAVGLGGLDPSVLTLGITRFGRRPTSPSLGSAVELGSDSGLAGSAVGAGCPAARAIGITRGMDDGVAVTMLSVLAGSVTARAFVRW